MKEMNLTIGGEKVTIVVNEGSGRIESGIRREVCPFCNLPDCHFSCDESAADFSEGDSIDNSESEEDVAARLKYNGVCDALESVILAHACYGIDVEHPKYIQSIETTLEAAGNALR